ncbi:hypothetical protein UlMin_019118 [Ulmus minor]
MAFGHQKVINELTQGRELATQLRSRLANSYISEERPAEEDLVMKIITSFSNSLFILNLTNYESDFKEEVLSPTQPFNHSHVNSPSLNGLKSEDSQESCGGNSTLKHNKKRKLVSHSRTRDTATLIDDGHQWRKYGQKFISDAKYPRNYFRCTYKNDQGCQATKQVQKIGENPSMYRTIYYGHHTCQNLLKLAPESILEYYCNSPGSDSSVFLSFHNNTPTTKQELPFFSSFTTPTKQEIEEEMIPCNDSTTTHNQTPSSSYIDVTSDQENYHHYQLTTAHGDVDFGMMMGPFDDEGLLYEHLLSYLL